MNVHCLFHSLSQSLSLVSSLSSLSECMLVLSSRSSSLKSSLVNEISGTINGI